MAYKTVYYGSAEGGRFKQRNVAGVTQEVAGKAKALAGQAQEQVQGMRTMATQMSNEMTRQTNLAEFKDNKALQDIQKLNQEVNGFAMQMAKGPGASYVADKRQEGIDLQRRYNAGDPDAVAKIEGDEQQLAEIEARIEKQKERVNEALAPFDEDATRASLQEKLKAENLRRLGSNVKWGYIRGGLVQASKGYGPHLHNMLNSSDETIEIDGKTYRVGDYYNIDDTNVRDKIVKHVEREYIGNNNPYGANRRAVQTYLTKAVVEATDKFQTADLVKYRQDQAELELKDQTNRIENAFETADTDDGASALVELQGLLNNGRGIHNRLGTPGSPGAATKSTFIKTVKDTLSRIPEEDRAGLIQKISNHKFCTAAGCKTLNDHWGNDWIPSEIEAGAMIAEQTRNAKVQGALETSWTTDLGTAQAQYYKDGNRDNYIRAITKAREVASGLAGLDLKFATALAWESKVIPGPQADAYVTEIIANSPDGRLTGAQAGVLPPSVQDDLRKRNLIVEERFGDSNIQSKQARQASVTNIAKHIQLKRVGIAGSVKGGVVPADAQRMTKIATRRLISTAERFRTFGGPDGQKFDSDTAAFKAAEQVIMNDMEAEKDDINSIYYLDPRLGYINTRNKGLDGIGYSDVQSHTTDKVKAVTLLGDQAEHSSVDLIGNASILDNSDLQVTKNWRGDTDVSPTIKKLVSIDPQGRDKWQILNANLNNRGLPLIPDSEIPEADLALRNKLDANPTLKKEVALAHVNGDSKEVDRLLDTAEQISLPKVQRVYTATAQPYSGITQETLPTLLSAAGLGTMSWQDYQGNADAQYKVRQFVVNDLMTKASALTNNSNTMLMMTGIGLKHGEAAMSDFNNPLYRNDGVRFKQSYRSGANLVNDKENTMAALTSEDIITRQGPQNQVIKEIIPAPIRGVFESETPNTIKDIKAQINAIETFIPTENLEVELTGALGLKAPSRVHYLANQRLNSLKNQLVVIETLKKGKRSVLFGREVRPEGVNNSYQWNWMIEGVVGKDRLREIKKQAYLNKTGDYKTELYRLLKLEPQFAGEFK